MHICSHVLHRCFPTLVFPSSEAYKETKWFLFHVQWGSLRARYNANMMRRDFSCLPSLVRCCCVSDRRRLDWQVFVQSWGLGGKLDHNLVACEEEKWQLRIIIFCGFKGILITATCNCLQGLLLLPGRYWCHSSSALLPGLRRQVQLAS